MSRRGLGARRTLREGFFLRRGSITGVARFPRLSFVLAHWLLAFVGVFFLLFRAIRSRRLRIEHIGGAENSWVFFSHLGTAVTACGQRCLLAGPEVKFCRTAAAPGLFVDLSPPPQLGHHGNGRWPCLPHMSGVCSGWRRGCLLYGEFCTAETLGE